MDVRQLNTLHVGSSMPNDWGGIERYVATLARAQAAVGDTVTVTAPLGSPLAAHSGVQTVGLTLRKKFDLRALSSYLSYFKQNRFDIVVTHYSPDYVVPAYAARLRKAGKILLTRHVAEPFRRDRAKLYAKLYDGYIGVSRAVGRELEKSGLPTSRIRSARGGAEALTPVEPAFWSGFRVGFFGRIVEQKGVEQLLEAKKLAREHWEVDIYGEGPCRPRLESMGVGVFHGKVEDVSAAMSRVDVVAIPSQWAEAFSIAALEALSIGKPLVASHVGGLPELFDTCSPGVLVPCDNPRAWADALDRYVMDRSLLNDHSRQAKDLYWSHYTPAHMAQRLRAAYFELID